MASESFLGLSQGQWGSAMSWGGKVLGAMGSIQAASATASALKDKAKLSRKEGREQKRLSDYRIRLIQREGREVLGEIQAETAKSGLAMTGTPLMSLVTTARDAELATALELRSGDISQQQYYDAAKAYERDAKAAKRAGRMGALSALIG